MKSIRIRLVVLFIVVTTVTLTAFGVYGQQKLAQSLELRFSQTQHATIARLAISLSEPVWNFDSVSLFRTLDVEMLQEEVNAIQVFGLKNKLLGTAMRDPQGNVIKGDIAADFDGIRVESDLYHVEASADAASSKPVFRDYMGAVVVYFTRAYIERALRSDTQRWMTEATVVVSVLVLALTLSMQTVFVPLQRLRNALFGLANSDADDVQELPETGSTEFVDVIRGFNLTQRKVRQVMQRHAQAKEDARASAGQARQALAQLQSTQQSLVEAEKLASLGGLVAGVAHEINTPVGITLTSASMLKEASEQLQSQLAQGVLRKSEVIAYVAMACESASLILTNSERAATLIQSFKQVAADQTSEHRRSYDLGLYLEEIVSSLRPKLKQSKTQCHVACDTGIFIDGYPGALAQVITNLTMNALLHAFKNQEQGRIDIRVQLGLQGEVILEFCDDGCGIAPAHLGKVFEPFFTTERGQGGTGLGLNIVQNIMAKQFGGTIVVQSELGKGACFVLRFPRISPLAEQKANDAGV